MVPPKRTTGSFSRAARSSRASENSPSSIPGLGLDFGAVDFRVLRFELQGLGFRTQLLRV